MRTYKEFVSLLEQPSGSLMLTKRFGSSGLGGSTAATANVSGGSAKGTQYSVTGTGGYGTVSGQGDKINKGVSASLSNTQSGGGDKDWKGVPYRTPNADTSTSTIRKGAFGSLSANVSGGGVRTASKPEPPKPEEKQPTERTSASQRTSGPTSAQVTSTSAQKTPTRSAPETAADREARWAAASRAKDELASMAAIDRARIAKGEKPKSDVLSKYPGAGLR